MFDGWNQDLLQSLESDFISNCMAERGHSFDAIVYPKQIVAVFLRGDDNCSSQCVSGPGKPELPPERRDEAGSHFSNMMSLMISYQNSFSFANI
jgi:hypothetical protein